jgi:phenylalanine ammonia-lyase
MVLKVKNMDNDEKNYIPGLKEKSRYDSDVTDKIIVRGDSLTIDDVIRVARRGVSVCLTEEEMILQRISKSHDFIKQAVESNQCIYGVTTVFGGMSNISVSKDDAEALQNNLAWSHKSGAGKKLPIADVRASMLLRANSLMRGASGIRLEIIQRLIDFLNAGITPHLYELGSIGASGDLVPLSYILGAVIGLDPSFSVDMKGKEVDSISALKLLNLTRLHLYPKEGLSMINGTSVMSAIAANCTYDAQILVALAMGAHALFIQGLCASKQSFHPYINTLKPHPGQIWTSKQVLNLLNGSRLTQEELIGKHRNCDNDLEQDRYSLRCLPQYMGPIVDGLSIIRNQVEVEINSATDNPLIDVDNETCYYCGNFLGQYIGVCMDQLRYYLGLLAKHLDVQIALLVTPEFSNGLPPSLVGNSAKKINLGLKGLQLTGNSIMPLLSFFGASLVDRFPTHAEQFNQNINSQGFGSANLTRQSVETFHQYMAVSLMFGIQAVDLRTNLVSGHFDARVNLSPATSHLYESILKVIDRSPSDQRPYIWNDDEQSFDEHIMKIAADIAADGVIPRSVKDILNSLKKHTPFN